MKPATKTEVQRPAKRGQVWEFPVERREIVIVSSGRKVTPEERRAAAESFIKGMPKLKPGEKPGHVQLAEYRAGK